MFFYLKAFIKGARLHTLPAILMPIGMAAAFAFRETKSLDKTLLVFTFLSGAFIQLAVNFFNDGLDFKQGTDTTHRQGFQRLTQQGLVSFQTVMWFGLLCVFLASLLALPLLFQAGLPILILGLVSLVCTYMYSGTSFAFSKTGASELFVVLFFGFGAVCGTYYIQTLSWHWDLVYLSLQNGFFALSLLIINHLRDESEDRQSGRKNLTVLYGRSVGLLQLVIVQALIYLLCFYWLNENAAAAAFSFLSLPFSALLLYFISLTPPSKKYNRFLILMSLQSMLFGSLWIVGTVFLT